MPYLIDGNNLLGMILGHDEQFAPVTDAQLCGDIDRFLWDRQEVGDLIFDGSGPPNKAPFRSLRCLDVAFAGEGTDADTAIESKLHVVAHAKRTIVVSDDRRLRGAARQHRARALRCFDFWQRVITFQQRRPRRPEPPSKRHGLSDEETVRWMTTFGLDAQDRKG